MDLFLFVYGVIVVIFICTVIGLVFAASFGLEWYRRYRHARLANPVRQAESRSVEDWPWAS